MKLNIQNTFPLADLLNINQQRTSKEYGSASKVEPRHLLGKPMTRIKTKDIGILALTYLSCLCLTLEILRLF